MTISSSYRPEGLTLSKFHFYSIGIVAENKALSSKTISVTPIEELPMLDGQITGAVDTMTATGTDAAGGSYTTQAHTSNVIEAEWLRLGEGNRLSAPDVRRGESVILYQFGDANTFYWTTLKNDSRLRRLETVIWGISGTRDEAANNGPDTMYYFEISSHKKHITVHTSQADGEQWGYDIQINTNDGFIVIQDTEGRTIKLDSAQDSLHLENAAGSVIDITKKKATILAKESVDITTESLTLRSSTGRWVSPSLNLASSGLIFTN